MRAAAEVSARGGGSSAQRAAAAAPAAPRAAARRARRPAPQPARAQWDHAPGFHRHRPPPTSPHPARPGRTLGTITPDASQRTRLTCGRGHRGRRERPQRPAPGAATARPCPAPAGGGLPSSAARSGVPASSRGRGHSCCAPHCAASSSWLAAVRGRGWRRADGVQTASGPGACRRLVRLLVGKGRACRGVAGLGRTRGARPAAARKLPAPRRSTAPWYAVARESS
jgi:hypothetical protein